MTLPHWIFGNLTKMTMRVWLKVRFEMEGT